MVLAAAAVVMAALTLTASPAADVKGKWEGTLTAARDDGTTNNDTALLILDQKGDTITGSIGGSESDQHAITKGSVEGNKVVIVASPGGREMRLDLTLGDNEMKGTITRGERTAQLHVKKRKE